MPWSRLGGVVQALSNLLVVGGILDISVVPESMVVPQTPVVIRYVMLAIAIRVMVSISRRIKVLLGILNVLVAVEQVWFDHAVGAGTPVKQVVNCSFVIPYF